VNTRHALLTAVAAAISTAAFAPAAHAATFLFVTQTGASAQIEVDLPQAHTRLELARGEAAIAQSQLDELTVADLQPGDVATVYNGSAAVVSAQYDGLPTLGDDACIGHSTFLATRAANASIVDAGASYAVGDDFQRLDSFWTREQASTVSVERPLAAGDVAYVETVVLDGSGDEVRSLRGKTAMPCYSEPTRTPPTGTPPTEQVIGPSPVTPTTAQALQAVRAALSATGSKLRTFTPARLSRKRTVALPFAFPEAGAVELQLVAKNKVLGTGAHSTAVNGKATVTVTLTAAARKLLKRSKRLKLTLKATFTPSRWGGAPAREREADPYGFVVESVNVSVLAYVPVRSASPAAIDCLKAIVTSSLETGAA
jgi:hypothetical protein